MATYATLIVNAKEVIGERFNNANASVWVEPDTPHGLIVVDGTTIRIGGRREVPDAFGIVTFPDLVTTNSADNPTTFGYRVTIECSPTGSREVPEKIITSSFPLTADANLAAISAAWDGISIPPNWRSDFMDAAQALLDQQEAIAGADTADELITVLDANPGSDFRVQQDARLEFGYGRQSVSAQVCIVVDDVFISQYRYGIPLAERYGHKLTIAAVSDWIGSTAAYMKSADILDAYQRGHEIASHSKTHAAMAEITSAQRATEFDTSKTAIEAIIGAGKCRNFIYPISQHNPTTDTEAYGRYVRTFAGNFYSETVQDPAGSRAGFVHGRQTWSRLNHSTILDLVREVAANRDRIVLYTHRLTDADDASVSLAQFEEMMVLLAELGIRGVTLSQAFPDQNLIRDPQFKDASLAWWSGTAISFGPSASNIAQDTTKALDTGIGGTTSLKIIGGTGSIRFVRSAPIPIAAFAGQEMTLKFRYFIDNAATIESGGGVSAGIYYLDGNESRIEPYLTGAQGTVKNAWTEYTYAFTVPNGATPQPYGITIDLRNTKVVGNAWFSHAYLAPTSEGVYG